MNTSNNINVVKYKNTDLSDKLYLVFRIANVILIYL